MHAILSAGMLVAFTILGPLAFGMFAATLMMLLFDIGIFNTKDRESEGNLKRAFAIMGWFFGNGASVLGTLWVIDLKTSFGNPRASGLALMGYLIGFGLTGTVLGFRSLYQYAQIQFGKHNPDLTNIETRVVLLVLRHGISPPHAAHILGITRPQLTVVYAAALTKMARNASAPSPTTA